MLYSCTEGMCHTPRYVIARDSVLPSFPRVSTVSDKRWGEKAWVRGYLSPTYHQSLLGSLSVLLSAGDEDDVPWICLLSGITILNRRLVGQITIGELDGHVVLLGDCLHIASLWPHDSAVYLLVDHTLDCDLSLLHMCMRACVYGMCVCACMSVGICVYACVCVCVCGGGECERVCVQQHES